MIVVFGSINIDLVTRAERIPAPGETVLGKDYVTIPGGKGANQALAARRAGAKVALVGAHGPDEFADVALSLLKAEGVDLGACRLSPKPTGAAFITVDPQGENAIVVASGANGETRAAQLESATLGVSDLLVLQREVPIPEIDAAAERARKAGAKVVLNAAPAGTLSDKLLKNLDYLIVNEHEVTIVGEALGFEGEPDQIAAAIDRERGIATIVTLGASGVVAYAGGKRHEAPAPRIEVVDTTAAGDAFVGSFSAALDEKQPFEVALLRGIAAGSLACTKAGAQPSLPMKAEIEAMAGKLRA